MKQGTKRLATALAAAAAFLLWMWRGLTPPAPQPGFMPGGAMAEPLGAAVGALLAAAAAGFLVRRLLRGLDRLKLSARKQGLLLAALALAFCLLAWYAWGRGSRPFAHLEGADLVSATVRLSPPDVTLELDRAELDELAGLLREVVVYERDGSWTEYAGQAVTYTLELAGGLTCTVTDYNPFLILDGVGYRTKYEPCEALNSFGNRLLRGYP